MPDDNTLDPLFRGDESGGVTMNFRRFGRTDWQVSDIGYGMWGMGDWKNSDDEESLNSLQIALDLNCNFFDTAWIYGHGKSEKILLPVMPAHWIRC